MAVYKHILEAHKSGKKLIARLIDPDNYHSEDEVLDEAARSKRGEIDLFFVGGSLISRKPEIDILKLFREVTSIPTVLFPSSPLQVNTSADAMLFLSLISGRNPEYLIGHHVTSAPYLKNTKMEILPTGYMLVSCGETTTAEYVSNSNPIPYEKPEIAAATAYAGQLLGLKLLYLDGGSGASRPISAAMISEVRAWTDLPIIVGGGIRTATQAMELQDAGADVIVVGNGADVNPHLIHELHALKNG